MNERRLVVTGAVGVTILVVVALVGIRLLGGGAAVGTGSPSATAAAPEPALPALAPEPAPAPAAAPAPEPAATAPQHTVVPAAVPRPPGATGVAPWESVETALRPSGLGVELAAPVSDALAEARDRLQPCFDEEARRLQHAKPTQPKPGVYGPAVLVLRLEALDGRLVVQDTEVASEGTSSPSLVECCRRMLQSYEFAAPVAPSQRYKVQMTLQ